MSVAQFPKESDQGGSFVRQDSLFRGWVTSDGSSEHQAEPGRYHLYISLACPWASRALIIRKVKGLEAVISLTVLDPIRDDRGWRFLPDEPDPINGFTYLSEAYEATDPSFDGRVTVPVLWDKQTGTIVNNESSEVIRMLNSAWDQWGDSDLDLYPEHLRSEIDKLNDRIYNTVNNGVYKAGFASKQSAYEDAFGSLFESLDWLEGFLDERRYLLGDVITEADWRLFVTLVRFDPVYFGHFKCNLREIAQYPNLSNYLRDLYQRPGIAETVNFDHIKRHYYMTHPQINPSRIVPVGPQQDLTAGHNRDRLGVSDPR